MSTVEIVLTVFWFTMLGGQFGALLLILQKVGRIAKHVEQLNNRED